MLRIKALRRRCDRPACGKLYRHSDPRSRTCSSSCRQRLCRERKKAAEQVAQEQIEAERHDQARARVARMRARMEAEDSLNRQPAPAPRPTTAPPPPTPTPAPPARVGGYILEPEEQTVIIKVPNTFPGTPLRRGRN